MKKKQAVKKIRFEDHISIIYGEIDKKKHKWNLDALAWIDYDDIRQIIISHIYKKWSQYNPELPLKPWVNRIISNQLKNLTRNNYGNFCKPCGNCAMSRPDDGCELYEKQCAECPRFANWMKSKKYAYATKIPTTIEYHTKEIHGKEDDSFDMCFDISYLHDRMIEVLEGDEYLVYVEHFIGHKNEKEVASMLGYKTSNEKYRVPGYKKLRIIKTNIINKAKEIIQAELF